MNQKEIYNDLLNTITTQKLIFLISGNSISDCIDLSNNITKQGYDNIGLDFRVPGLKETLKKYKRKGLKNFGVFNICTKKDARIAINSGARFIFTPHIEKGIIRRCRKEKLFNSAGALTPYEINLCNELICDSVSIYPSKLFGGLEWFGFLKRTYPSTRFIPTDSFDSGLILEYLRLEPFAVADIIDLKQNGNFDETLKNLEKLRSEQISSVHHSL